MKNKSIIKLTIVGVLAILIIITLFSSFKSIPTGYVGVKTRFGEVQSTVLHEGLNGKLPFIEKIVLMNCKTQKCEYTMETSTKDLQIITNFQIAVNFNINSDKANELYRTVGEDYINVIVQPAIYESVKYGTSNYTAEEMVTMRGVVSDTIWEILKHKLEEKGISVTAVSILDLNFSAEYDKAIEQKQVVEQQTKTSQLELEKAKIDNEKKIENAKTEAEVMKQQNAQITEQTLKLKELEIKQKLIEKWNGSFPATMLSDNINTLFNIGN